MTTPLGGGGLTFDIASGSSSPTRVGRIRTIGSRSTPAAKIDVSSMDTVQFKEFVYGLGERGDLSLAGVYDAGNDAVETFRNLVGDGEAHDWTITLKDGTTVEGAGNVLQFDFEFAYDGAYTFTAVIGVTGDVSVTPAS